MTRTEFMNMPPHDFWSIAAALRGPDFQPLYGQAGTDEVRKLKLATTAVIRCYAGFIIESSLFGLDCNEDREEWAALRRALDHKLSDHFFRIEHPGLVHFLAHARAAFTALKLEWSRNNTRRSTP